MVKGEEFSIGAFLIEQGNVNWGTFIGLSIGPGLTLRDDGRMLGIDISPSGTTAVLSVFSNATRPAPDSVPPGTMIFNSDNNFPNVSDGNNWRDMVGGIV